MTKNKDPNQKHYFDTVPKSEQLEAFKTMNKAGVEITVWCKGEKETDAETFEILSYNQDNGLFILESKGGFLSKITGSPHANKDVLVKIPFGKVHYFTSTHLYFDKITGQYSFKIQETVYISRQRSNYRLMANQYNKIQFKLNEEVFDALDISAGGTSITVPDSRTQEFAKGSVFEDCTLRFNKVNFEIKRARIAGTWECKNDHGDILPEIKLGIAFDDIPSDVEEALFKHINSEARLEEVRKKMNKKTSV